jgi:hypothetical protein
MSFEYLSDFLSGVVGVVEANSYESLCLWRDFHKEQKMTWVQGLGGYVPTIGMIDGRPVCLSLFVNTIGGHKILFIEGVSQVVDHVMIDAWLKANLPATALRDGGEYLNKANAMNFHSILPSKP